MKPCNNAAENLKLDYDPTVPPNLRRKTDGKLTQEEEDGIYAADLLNYEMRCSMRRQGKKEY